MPACGLLRKFERRGDTMIINPSAHTMIPRRNSFQNRTVGRRRQALSVPGGKQLWYGVMKMLGVAAVVVAISSFWLNGSVERLSADIEEVQATHSELVNANLSLRVQRAQLFSSEAVEALADNQLAIHVPTSGQYYTF